MWSKFSIFLLAHLHKLSLNGLLDPTREMGELDGFGRSNSPNPTLPFGELDGLLDPILPFGGMDVGVLLSGIRCLGPRATFLEGLCCKSLSNLL